LLTGKGDPGGDKSAVGICRGGEEVTSYRSLFKGERRNPECSSIGGARGALLGWMGNSGEEPLPRWESPRKKK